MPRYALGLDFGTGSARALLVDVETGAEAAQSVRAYPDGVITESLPIPAGPRLPRDWALQNPADWLTVLKQIVPEAMSMAKAKPWEVVGIGVDFTACTLLPVTADGTPLSFQPQWRHIPNAWCKLWKHHGADPEVRHIMNIATQRKEAFLPYYGGCMSSEWLLPKALQVLRESPDVYKAADYFIEAGDWIVWKLTGRLTRNSTAAGYKGTWVHELGFPSPEFLEAVDPGLKDLFTAKVRGAIVPPGVQAGLLTAPMAEELGLDTGTPVSAATIDAHAGVPGCGVTTPGVMTIIMGTSSCHMLLAKKPVLFEGFAGLVKDGIIPGFYGYESGQTAVGDIFAWFTDNCCPQSVAIEAKARGVSLHDILTERASAQRPGESGLLALDWWNGNRSILMNAQLSGLLVGATLNTKPHEIYRALIE
ncbi:MAG TPA: ribulokinase, partial [Candidatus Brocadiia bacterium]|nr:ribulokinase [Candidatus Brocadiia bacterium]